MGKLTITVHPGTADGTVRAPGSKSVTHRALFLALLCDGGSIRQPLWSADTRASLHAIRALGAKVVATNTEVVVRGGPFTPAEIDAANAGTTLRLATAAAALAPGTSELTGDESLRSRPMGPLVDALTQLGAQAVCHGKDGRPPVEVTGPATGGTARVSGDVSSQFVSALMLAGPRMPEGVEIELTTELTSRPYAELTAGMMREQGLTVEATDDGFRVPAQEVHPVAIQVPGDYSAAAFPLVAGAITGGTVTVTGLVEGSGQGDEALVEFLRAFGAQVSREVDRVTVEGEGLHGTEVDLADNPDLFPPLAVLAACAQGTTRLHGAPHLRHKESDRIAAMTDGLQALGCKVEPRDDGAVIEGSSLQGGTVATHDDHRIQMAFAVAALAAQGPVTLTGQDDAHGVSYPGFLEDLDELGAQVDQDEEGDA